MGLRIKGEIIEEDVSYNGLRSKEIMIRTREYETYRLSEDFRSYVGDTITIKIKWSTEL